MQFWQKFLDIIFPPKCLVCKDVSKDPLCLSCIDKINFLRPTAFVHSVAAYDGPLKKAILNFKFKNKKDLAEPLGKLIIRYLNEFTGLLKVDMIIPVPLHPKRLDERGFNQVELLSWTITKRFDIPTVSGLLFRKKETTPQFDLPKKERYTNIKGAFEVKGKKFLEGKSVLLIDDIYTTGSTVAECTKTLKTAGALKVYILTLSKVVDII